MNGTQTMRFSAHGIYKVLVKRSFLLPAPLVSAELVSVTGHHTDASKSDQALSSSCALPFVSFLLPSSAAPTAALINSPVLFSALLPKRRKKQPRKSTSES